MFFEIEFVRTRRASSSSLRPLLPLRSRPVSADYEFRSRATRRKRLRRVHPQPIKIMNDQDPSASSENRLSEPESSPTPRGLSPVQAGPDRAANGRPPQKTGEPKQVKIVLRIEAVESQLASVAQPAVEIPAPALPQPPPSPSRHENEPQQIPARMLNEFVYCQRLFYYEFVEGVFVESVDTLRGDAIHKRVDSGNGALPAAKKKRRRKTTQDEPAATVDATSQRGRSTKRGTRNNSFAFRADGFRAIGRRGENGLGRVED